MKTPVQLGLTFLAVYALTTAVIYVLVGLPDALPWAVISLAAVFAEKNL